MDARRIRRAQTKRTIVSVLIMVILALALYFLLMKDDSEDGEPEIGLTWDCECDNNIVVYKVTRTPTPEGVVLRVHMRVFEHYQTMTLDWNATLTDGDTYHHQDVVDVPDFPDGAEALPIFTFRFPEGLDLVAVDVVVHSCT